MSDKTHPLPLKKPKKGFRLEELGKLCVWLEKLGDANGKCTPPPEPPRFFISFFRSSLCFFPMHMHTMHCIAFAFGTNLFSCAEIGTSSSRCCSGGTRHPDDGSCVALRGSCSLSCVGVGVNQERGREKEGKRQERKAEGVRCLGVLYLRRCADGRWNRMV